MWRTLLIAMISLTCLSANAEVVYIKRSELWAHELGKSVRQGVESYNDWNGYMGARDADYTKLEELKRKVASCNQCPDRDRLVTQANELEARLTQFDDMLCGTFDAMKQFSTAARDTAIKKLLRIDSVCEKVTKRKYEAMDREYFEKQYKRIAAGDLDGYAEVGMRHIMDRDRAWIERNSAGCPWLYRGAQLGNARSTTDLAFNCMFYEVSTEQERKQIAALLKACSDRGENSCTQFLAEMYSETFNKTSHAPFPPNNEEALRLWELAAARGHSLSAERALRLRSRMGLSQPEAK